MWWRTLIRDLLSPLVGLAIEVHEAVWADEPRYLAVIAGLVLVGVPIDSALRALSGGQAPSSHATPPSAPSSAPESDGG